MCIRHCSFLAMLWITLLYVGTGLLLAVLAVPMIQRRIKPNPFYGFRVPKAYKNEAIWFEINAYAGVRLLIAGLVIAGAAVVLALIPNLSFDVYSILIAVVLVVAMSIGMIQSFRHLNEIAK